MKRNEFEFISAMLGVDFKEPLPKEYYRNRHIRFSHDFEEDNIINKMIEKNMIDYILSDDRYSFFVTPKGIKKFEHYFHKKYKNDKLRPMSEAPEDRSILILDVEGEWHICIYEEGEDSWLVTDTYDLHQHLYVENPKGWIHLPNI